MHHLRGAVGEVITIGLDIAKSVFQVHGMDVEGAVVIRKHLDGIRSPLDALWACGCSKRRNAEKA